MHKQYEISALILRLVLGATFLIHGFAKFQGGIGNIVGFFESVGIPGFLAYIVAIIELVGGFALILGLGTRVISAFLSIIMIGAILTVKLPLGFLGNGQMAGYELDVALLAMAVSLVITGSSLYSIDSLFQKSQKTNLPG